MGFNLKFDTLYKNLEEYQCNLNDPLMVSINAINEEMNQLNSWWSEGESSRSSDKYECNLNSDFEESVSETNSNSETVSNQKRSSKSFYIENLILDKK